MTAEKGKGGVGSPPLIPLYRRVVHLVDEEDEFVDAVVLDENGVLSGLALALKAGLKLAFPSGQDLQV